MHNNLNALVEPIAQIIEQARGQVRHVVNSAMVHSYWHIGEMIVEHEQQGASRAEYGTQQLQVLSTQLTERLGKGFDVRNLRNMRAFYQAFPIRNALRTELSWTHYRSLLRIDNSSARQWYLQEAISQNWSARALDRQISKLYYERLLASQDKALVEAEAKAHTEPLAQSVKDYLRDPYILDFLNLQDKSYQESELEQAIISNIQQFLLELGKGFAFVERQQRIRFAVHNRLGCLDSRPALSRRTGVFHHLIFLVFGIKQQKVRGAPKRGEHRRVHIMCFDGNCYEHGNLSSMFSLPESALLPCLCLRHPPPPHRVPPPSHNL